MFDSELCFEAHLSKWFCFILGFLVIALAEYFLVANSNHLVFIRRWEFVGPLHYC